MKIKNSLPTFKKIKIQYKKTADLITFFYSYTTINYNEGKQNGNDIPLQIKSSQ